MYRFIAVSALFLLTTTVSAQNNSADRSKQLVAAAAQQQPLHPAVVAAIECNKGYAFSQVAAGTPDEFIAANAPKECQRQNTTALESTHSDHVARGMQPDSANKARIQLERHLTVMVPKRLIREAHLQQTMVQPCTEQDRLDPERRKLCQERESKSVN